MNLDFYWAFADLSDALQLPKVAAEWRKMQANADIIETVNNDWFKRVGTTIFSTQVINVIMPQILVVVNVLIAFIINIPKLCKYTFYTSDEIKDYYRGPDFNIAERMSYVVQIIFTC